MPGNPIFRADDVSAAQRFLREALGLGPEDFSTENFLSMLGEEVGQLLSAGRTPAEISEIIARATGKTIPPAAIGAVSARGAGRRPEELNAANDG